VRATNEDVTKHRVRRVVSRELGRLVQVSSVQFSSCAVNPLFKVQLLYVSYALTIKRSLLIDETMIVHAVVYESAAMVTDLKTVLCLGSPFINTSNVCNVIGLHLQRIR